MPADPAIFRSDLELKGMLYDLQNHNCNGTATVPPDGPWSFRSCTGCVEIERIRTELHRRRTAEQAMAVKRALG